MPMVVNYRWGQFCIFYVLLGTNRSQKSNFYVVIVFLPGLDFLVEVLHAPLSVLYATTILNIFASSFYMSAINLGMPRSKPLSRYRASCYGFWYLSNNCFYIITMVATATYCFICDHSLEPLAVSKYEIMTTSRQNKYPSF